MGTVSKYFKWIAGSGFLVMGILGLLYFQTDNARAKPEVREALKVLQKRQKEERRSLSRFQTHDMKQWKLKERDARRAFFAENRQGEKRRAYIQDYIKRVDAFELQHKKQWSALKARHGSEIDSLKESDQMPNALIPIPEIPVPTGVN